MTPRELRSEYAAFCAAFERARFDFYSGDSAALNLEPLRDRYADLWTLANIEDVRRARDETSAQFSTERAALFALEAALAFGFIEAQTRDVSEELARCEAAARVSFRGERIEARRIPLLLDEVADANERRELAARWADALASCDDLRAATIEAQRAALKKLGFDSSLALHERITGFDINKFASDAARFLERTAKAYGAALARWSESALQIKSAQLSFADSFLLERAAPLDPHLKAEAPAALFRATLDELKIHDALKNRLALRASASESLRARGAACCAFAPPDDVRVLFRSESNGRVAVELFRAGGAAQTFLWSSAETAARFPEFVFAPDRATSAAFGALFTSFFKDEAWLAENLKIKADEVRRLARFLALRDLFRARRACGLLSFAIEFETANDLRDAHLGEAYAELLSEATEFRYAPQTCLRDAQNALNDALTELRAQLFAVALVERLRTRYGSRWRAARGARDELIDMWNTTSRYSVEELARLTDVGELSFDLLGENLTTAARDA